MSLASMIELHRLMLKDSLRNVSYARAISEVIKRGDVVLDLGAGTGFLAMLAAKAGARKVLAVEAADIADIGKRLTQDNRLTRVIEWHDVPSTELRVKEKADVLITETFGSHPFEECAHEFVRDARARLCKPDARVIPSHVEVYAAPIELIEQRAQWDLFEKPIQGLDFSRLRPIAMGSMYAEQVPASGLLAPGALLERVELGGDAHSKRTMKAEWTVTRAGEISGIAQWFRLRLTDDVWIDTAPDKPVTHWRQIVYPLMQPRRVKKGDHVRATIKLDTRLHVELDVKWQLD